MKQASVIVLAMMVTGVSLVSPELHGQVAPPAATGIAKETGSFREVVKKVQPAVVSIEGHARAAQEPKARPGQQRPPLPDNVPEQFRKFFEDFGAPFDTFDVPETPRQGLGSGFFIDPNGVLLTNYHVVDGCDHVTVTLQDGRKFSSREIVGDRRTDLAIIRVAVKGQVPYLELGDSDAVEIGDRVLAFGAPFGLTGSVTQGIVSAKGRSGLFRRPGEINYEDFLQTDAAINPGNSGGPLVSLDGKVVGINTAIKSRSGGFQGVGLAVASNLAKQVTAGLLRDGVVHRGYLGVQIRDLTPEVARRLKLPASTTGVVLTDVFDDTPAARAGLKAGDVLTHVAGQPIKDSMSLQITVAGLPLGKPVEAGIVRDGLAKKVSVMIEEQPKDFGTSRAPARDP